MRIVPPYRVRHVHVQHLSAPPAAVFPLLCPVREAEWVAGWDPTLVATESGFAERDCVFVVASEGEEAIWTVTEYDPSAGRISFVKVTPGVTVAHIDIAVRGGGAGGSEVEVAYQHTALSEEGMRFVDGFTADHYAAFMMEWESQVERYLAAGWQAAPVQDAGAA